MFHQLHEGWTIGDHLNAAQLDSLRWLQWAKTGDGQNNLNRPEPTPRPGMTDALEDEAGESVMTVEDYLRYAAEAAQAEEG